MLGGQSVVNTGPTSLSSDLGVSPGTAITGFPPGTLGGTSHAADPVAAQAQSDLGIAYYDAASQATTQSVSGDLVGRTLVAGVYTAGGPISVSGTLTFDGQNDPNSVFIVQAASTLITASASHINTIRGADACHIFWQVGSSATLGTASTFQGSILALTSVTVTTGAHVQGRALARNGAVTLDDDVFTSPACSTTPPSTPPTTTPPATPPPATTAPPAATPTSSTSSTTTTLTSSPTTVTGGTVTVTATVTSPHGTPTGQVKFYEGNTLLKTVTLTGGRATITVAAGTTPATRTITAIYAGSPSYTASPRAHTTFTVTSSTTPTVANAGGSTSGTLPNTGTSHLTAISTTGVLLLLVGTGLTLSARRRLYTRRH